MSERENRRQLPRARFDRPVAVQSGGRLFTADLEQISEGGLRLACGELDLRLTELTVRVPLRGRFGRVDHCDLSGRVVRHRDSTVGVALGRLLPRHLLQLRDYVWRASREAAQARD